MEISVLVATIGFLVLHKERFLMRLGLICLTCWLQTDFVSTAKPLFGIGIITLEMFANMCLLFFVRNCVPSFLLRVFLI